MGMLFFSVLAFNNKKYKSLTQICANNTQTVVNHICDHLLLICEYLRLKQYSFLWKGTHETKWRNHYGSC